MHRPSNWHRRRNSTNAAGGLNLDRLKPSQPLFAQTPGQTTFRLMCHIFTAGGVIGHAGKVIKLLEKQTSTKVHLEEPLPDSVERVIMISGSVNVNRTITVKGDNGGEEEQWNVSPAQEGLIRVFERVLEVEEENEGGGMSDRGGGGNERCCRLLAVKSQIGAIMGKGGKNVAGIRNDTGARISVLQAHSAEGLIHITGGLLAVKKAVIITSRYLQDNSPFPKAPIIPSGTFTDPHAEFFPELTSLLLHLPENSTDRASNDHVDDMPNADEKDAQRNVVFRLLCPANIVGGVIGTGGSIVRTLQNETGASITFADPVAGSNERLIIISALENPNTSHSPTQNAVVRVFARAITTGIEKGIMSFMNKGETLTARLLIASDHASYLTRAGDTFVSELEEVTGAELQISRGEHHPCGLETDELVQITGRYRNVQGALLHVTGRLMDHFFPNNVVKGAKTRSYHVSAIPDMNPYIQQWNTTQEATNQYLGHSHDICQERTTLGNNHFGVSNRFGSYSFKSHLPMTAGRRHKTKNEDSTIKTDGGSLQHEGTRISPMVQTTIEVVVPEESIGSVYGENGRNLKLIKQISGAKVIMADLSSGKSEGCLKKSKQHKV